MTTTSSSDELRSFHLHVVLGPARRDARALEGHGIGLVGSERRARSEGDRSRSVRDECEVERPLDGDGILDSAIDLLVVRHDAFNSGVFL